ncbi:acetate kinase [Phycicoccus ginsengisoli]
MSPQHVLVVNAGSSSLKYQVVDGRTGQTSATGLVERIGGEGHLRHTSGGRTHERDVPVPDHAAALGAAQQALREHGPDLDAEPPVAVGHRVVHGGARFSAPVLVDDRVLDAVRDLGPLAPLHNPANLEGIETALRAFPGVPQVAVFDTAFHQTLPEHAYTYAVPREWRDRHRVRRYGFHGTSFAYVSRRACEVLGRVPGETNLVVLHLGNGASACAVAGGRSVDTSMGLSPLEGLVMGTRPGDLDPALGAYLSRAAGLDPAAYDKALNTASGLLGLAGIADLREVQQRRAAGDPDARLAFDVMTYRLRKYVGAYAVALGRVDAIVFTGGIGEHSAEVRAAVLGDLGLLGVELDADANDDGPPERVVTTAASRVVGLVVPTNEELEIARACLAVVGERSGG